MCKYLNSTRAVHKPQPEVIWCRSQDGTDHQNYCAVCCYGYVTNGFDMNPVGSSIKFFEEIKKFWLTFTMVVDDKIFAQIKH